MIETGVVEGFCVTDTILEVQNFKLPVKKKAISKRIWRTNDVRSLGLKKPRELWYERTKRRIEEPEEESEEPPQ